MGELRGYWQRTISRRAALRGAALGGTGLLGAALLGCGGDDDDDDAGTASPTAAGGGSGAQATPTPTEAASSSGPRHGGTLRQVTQTQAPHFSPLHPGAEASLTPTWRRANGYYDYLWGLRESDDPERQFFLRAAASVEQPEETELIVHLTSARFHNQPANDFNDTVGQREVDSEDLTELLEFLKVPPASLVQRLKDDLTVEAIDAKTVRYRLARPYAFLFEAGNPILLPRELLDEQTLKSQPPIGTGPYMYQSHTLGSIEEAVRNPDYFVADRPYPDGKKITTVPDSASVEAAFLAGQIDHMSFDNVKQRDAVVDQLGDAVVPRDYPSSSGMALLLNIRKPPFTDIRVREAIHRAIDVQQVVDKIFFGDAERSWVFAKGRPDRFPIGFEAVEEFVGHDKERAAQLIAAARSDGSYDGRELEFMLPAETQTWVDSGRFMAADLNEVGLNVKTKQEVRNIYLLRAGPKDTANPDNPSDFDITMTVFLSYTSFLSDSGTFWNNAGLEDPQIDDQIAAIYAAIDPVERADLSHEFELMMAEKYSNFVPVLTGNQHGAWYAHVRDLDFEDSRSGQGGWQINMWLDT